MPVNVSFDYNWVAIALTIFLTIASGIFYSTSTIALVYLYGKEEVLTFGEYFKLGEKGVRWMSREIRLVESDVLGLRALIDYALDGAPPLAQEGIRVLRRLAPQVGP